MLDSDYRNTSFKNNLYFTPSASLKRLEFPNNLDFAQWQQHGQDSGSLCCTQDDPMFVDFAAKNFTLQPSSPAFALGFKQLPSPKRIGPQGNVFLYQ